MTLKEKIKEFSREIDLYELDKNDKQKIKDTGSRADVYISGMERAFELVADLIEEFKVDIDLDTKRKVRKQ